MPGSEQLRALRLLREALDGQIHSADDVGHPCASAAVDKSRVMARRSPSCCRQTASKVGPILAKYQESDLACNLTGQDLRTLREPFTGRLAKAPTWGIRSPVIELDLNTTW